MEPAPGAEKDNIGQPKWRTQYKVGGGNMKMGGGSWSMSSSSGGHASMGGASAGGAAGAAGGAAGAMGGAAGAAGADGAAGAAGAMGGAAGAAGGAAAGGAMAGHGGGGMMRYGMRLRHGGQGGMRVHTGHMKVKGGRLTGGMRVGMVRIGGKWFKTQKMQKQPFPKIKLSVSLKAWDWRKYILGFKYECKLYISKATHLKLL